MENGAARVASGYPHLTFVPFDDRTTDGKTHPHAMIFGCKEWLEDLITVGGINSNPSIFYRHLYTVVPVQFGFYGQHTRPYRPHGIDGIHDQIEHNLLQLNFVAFNEENSFVELRPKIDTVFL